MSFRPAILLFLVAFVAPAILAQQPPSGPPTAAEAQQPQALTGEDRMDANSMMEYFAPLKKWLDEQTKGQKIGWTMPAR